MTQLNQPNLLLVLPMLGMMIAGCGGTALDPPTPGSSAGSGSVGGNATSTKGGGNASTAAGGTSNSPTGGSGTANQAFGGVGGNSTGGASNSTRGGSGSTLIGGSGGQSTSGGATSTTVGGFGGAATDGGSGDCRAAPGIYRNLFSEILSKSTTEINAKVNAAFQQLFHGSSNNVYYEAGSDEAYILDTGHDDVRSEGMSYGMMIAVQLDKQTEFDRLWKFAKQHMYHSSGARSGYFAWQVSTSGAIIDQNSAADGEEYFATALIFANKRWGDGTGIYAYSAEAKALLDVMVHKGESSEAQAAGVTSMFDPTQKLVVFTPVGGAATFTDPSYHLPAFYELWSCFDTKNQAFWKTVTANSRAFLQKATHATTGLAPEYANFDGTPSTQSTKGDFRYDSWRVVANVMMDHHFYGVEAWQTSYATHLSDFLKGQGDYGSEYTLSGTELTSGHGAGLVGMNATLGFALPSSDASPFVQELWDVAIPTGSYRYYSGMLYMLGLLHASGSFHLWY